MSNAVEKCKIAMQALSDWAVTYAPDMCDAETVAKAKQRIHQHGTLAYIANATDQLQSAITALSEAEQRVKDARREALEEAASWHDHEIARLNLQIEENNEFGEDRSFKHQVYAGNEYCRKLKSHHKQSAKSIRALIPSDPHDAEGRE